MLWGITAERIESWLNPDPDQVVGVAASSGVVEGVTAPSWAPLFAKIKAAVSDIGGTMSHAAIVAREYGMPAVAGRGDATKRSGPATGSGWTATGDGVAVAVVVQRMVRAAGAMFTRSPVTGDRSVVAIEGTWGPRVRARVRRCDQPFLCPECGSAVHAD